MNQQNSFDLLDPDLTKYKSESINQIFLLNRSSVPDGQPTGVDFELLTHQNYPDFDETQLDDRLLPFLLRDCAVSKLDYFRDMKRIFDRDGHFPAKGSILRGPAGAGKSYVLYHCVQFCRASGWLVLYIPTLGTLKDYDNETAAITILERFLEAETDKLKEIKFNKAGTSLYDFISDGLDNEEYFETWKKFISLICAKRLKYPVLVAIDEWNAKFDESKCKDLFDYFGLEKLNAGFWLYAVSSSFDPDPDSAFQNADKQTLGVEIPRYNEKEFDAILNCQQHYKRLPNSTKKKFDNKLCTTIDKIV